MTYPRGRSGHQSIPQMQRLVCSTLDTVKRSLWRRNMQVRRGGVKVWFLLEVYEGKRSKEQGEIPIPEELLRSEIIKEERFLFIFYTLKFNLCKVKSTVNKIKHFSTN